MWLCRNDPILGASAADISSVFQTNVIGTVLVTQVRYHQNPYLSLGELHYEWYGFE